MGVILTVGPADKTQESRQLLLETVGSSVKHVSSQDALTTLRTQQFDVIILDHAVPDHIEAEILAVADEHTGIVRLGVFTRPEELLNVVNSLIGTRREVGKVIRIDRR